MSSTTSQRPISRIETARSYPGDSQVKARKIVVSFESYERTDPFIMMAEDWFDRTGGFETHPHRGFETVTFALEGAIAHKDSKGNEGLLKPGDVQWMTAGRGILHSEIAQGEEQVHSLQLWLNLPSKLKMVEPRYQDLSSNRIPVKKIEGGEIRVISGEFNGVKSETKNHHPVTALEVILQASAKLELTIDPTYRAFVYVLQGEAVVADTKVGTGNVIWFDPHSDDSLIQIDSINATKVLIIAGAPINEKIVQHGPFVMNTREEIQQAFNDFHSGTFGN